MQSVVNDIVLKFVNDPVYDIRKDPKKYLKNRAEFKDYMEKKRFPNSDKKPVNSCETICREEYVEKRERYLHIDSSDRDSELYPDPQQYTIDVSSYNFTNVIQIELIGTRFFNFRQLISSSPESIKNNRIQWNVIDDVIDSSYITYTAELTAGNYTPETLADEIADRMNEVARINGEMNFFTVELNTIDDTVEIAGYDIETLISPFDAVAASNEITVNYADHALSISDTFTISNAETFAGIPATILNTSHTVTATTVNTFTFEININATSTESGGGSAVQIQSAIETQLLFSEDNNFANILGFDSSDTVFSLTHTNTSSLNVLGNQYILLCSEVLSGNFSTSNVNINAPFAKIYLPGDTFDSVFDSYVCGTKDFYNNELDVLNSLDFTFVYNDGSSVDFRNMNHSMVFKITELIQKVEHSDFSSKIGKHRNVFFS